MNTRATQSSTFPAPAPARARLAPAAAREAARGADAALCVLLGVYLTTLLLEGVLRYLVVVAGIPDVLYLRDAIPVASVLFLFLRTLLRDGRIDVPIALAAALLACHAAYAAVLGVAFFSIAFGLKIFMFVLYGMAMWPLLRPRLHAVLIVGSVMFVVTAAGVFTNVFLGKMPWEGMDYQTAFGASSTTREWSIAIGVSRLPGLTRTNFNAAMILGITGLLMLVKVRHPLARLAICAAAIAAIVLTTSKGMMLAFPVAALWLLVQNRRPRMEGHLLLATLCTACVAIPLIVVFYDIGSSMKASNFPALLVSVWERFTMMWPLAFNLLPEGPGALLGAGLGSIGSPQLFGHAPHQFNAADSLAVFMIINFGVPGLLYYAFPAFMVRKVAAAYPADVQRIYVSVLVIAYAYGLSINMIEESFFSIFFGLCFGAAASAWLHVKERKA